MNIGEFNQIIEKIADPHDKDISRAMAVVLLALQVGPFSKRLTQETGYSESFIDAISIRMLEAGLWCGGLVDDTELWDAQGDLRKVGLFTHALVALGRLKRQRTSYGALYLNASTGEIAGEWQYSEVGEGPGRWTQ